MRTATNARAPSVLPTSAASITFDNSIPMIQRQYPYTSPDQAADEESGTHMSRTTSGSMSCRSSSPLSSLQHTPWRSSRWRAHLDGSGASWFVAVLSMAQTGGLLPPAPELPARSRRPGRRTEDGWVSLFTEAMTAGVVVGMVDVQMRKEKLTVGGEYPGRCTLLQAGIRVLSKTSAPGVKHLANDHANQNIPVSCTPFPFAVQGATSQSWWSSLRCRDRCVAKPSKG